VAGDFLLLKVANSKELRTAIELCQKKPPTVAEGIRFDQRAIDKATSDDYIRFHDLEENGVYAYSTWPDKYGVGQRAYPPFRNHEPKDWDTAKDRHFIINLKSDYEEAYAQAKRQSSQVLDWDHIQTARDKVETEFKAKKMPDPDKLTARTVLYLFQLIATVIQ